jgi:hypothetical protein
LESGYSALDKIIGNTVNAYVCRGVECLPAIEDLESLIAII